MINSDTINTIDVSLSIGLISLVYLTGLFFSTYTTSFVIIRREFKEENDILIYKGEHRYIERHGGTLSSLEEG